MSFHPEQESYRFCPACGQGLEVRFIEGRDRPVCPGCGRIHYLDPKVAAGCVVLGPDQRILLVKRSITPVGTWTYPGGYVDRGESPAEAAARETWEEAGVKVEVESFHGLYQSPGSIVLVLVYMARASTLEVQVGPECQQAAWFEPAEIPWGELSFPSTRKALRAYLGLPEA